MEVIRISLELAIDILVPDKIFKRCPEFLLCIALKYVFSV